LEKDKLYAKPIRSIKDFKFDNNVAEVFENMIKRSVPGYESIIPMMSMMAGTFIKPGTNCFDLGSSLGATSLAISRGIIETENIRIFAVENSHSMIRQSKDIVKSDDRISLVCSDIMNIRIVNASMVVLNFTLQFIQPDQRIPLLSKIFDGLLDDGVLILSEKIIFEEKAEQQLHSDLHHAYKKFHGYSDLEISQKRTALENIMRPESVNEHIHRLRTIGFKSVYQWFQCYNFISIIAVKSVRL